jgi:hypothetical protein
MIVMRSTTMISDIGEIFSAQKNGSPPTISGSGCAPGESGVSVVSLRYEGSVHFSAYLGQRLIAFVSKTRIKCRLAVARCITRRTRDRS